MIEEKAMYKKITTYLASTFSWLTVQVAYSQSLGDVSRAALVPLTGIQKMLNAISTIAGIAFLMGAIIQYNDHRKNPIQVTISKPTVYLILGIIFLILPYWSKLSATAKAFLN